MGHTHSCMLEGTQDNCVSIVPPFNHLREEQTAEIKKMVMSLTFEKGEWI